jgi:dihydrofolate reductase
MENYMYNDVLNKVDAILLGRMAYQLLADYWQSATDSIASKMNNLPKIVFSKTLEKVGWNNSRKDRENLADEVLRMKQEPSKDLVLFTGNIL